MLITALEVSNEYSMMDEIAWKMALMNSKGLFLTTAFNELIKPVTTFIIPFIKS